MNNDPVDVLIIGGGASGAAIAWSLAETRMNILCLEQGDWMLTDEYPSTRTDYELDRFGKFSANPNIRNGPADYPINSDDSHFTPLNFNAVGGGSIIYIGHFPRFHPSDFRVKTLDGVAEDWPIDYQTLEPFYAINDRMMGVSGLAGNPSYPPYSLPHPPIPIGKIGHTMAEGFNRLGWHWWPCDAAILSRDHGGRAKCVNAGPCDLGCATGAKASTDITYWPNAIRNGVRIRTRCRVREITLGKDGMASGVLYHNRDGELQQQKASVVILACNAIGTPRILSNSRSNRFPDGLANRSGMVGRNLMVHPDSVVGGIFEEPMDSLKGPMGCCITSQEFYETDLSRGFVRGCTFEGVRDVGPVTATRGGMVVDSPIDWGTAHRQFMDNYYGHTGGISIISEDLPDPENRVTLDPELVDSDGLPAPRVIYTQDENNKRLLAYAEKRAREVLEAAGAIKTATQSTVPAAWHQLGTARMGNDPDRSVVNSWGRCHDVKNLFIADASVFVTSASANPTNTIQAVALYIGDQIKRNLANLFN